MTCIVPQERDRKKHQNAENVEQGMDETELKGVLETSSITGAECRDKSRRGRSDVGSEKQRIARLEFDKAEANLPRTRQTFGYSKSIRSR